MPWSMLADAVVVIHVAFVAFVVAGGLLVARWPRVAWVHLPAAAWGAWVELAGWVCPLTPLENALRARAGEAAYGGDFVGRYVLPVLYPDSLTRPTQVALGCLVVLVNLAAYARIRGHSSFLADGTPTPQRDGLTCRKDDSAKR